VPRSLRVLAERGMMRGVMPPVLTALHVPARRILLIAAAAALAVAACNTSVAPSLAPVSPSAAAVSPSPTPNIHAAPELEARLPDTLGGVAMTKLSLDGADFLSYGTSEGQTQVRSMLQQLGKGEADLLVAQAYDATGGSNDQAAIFQVKGADPAKLLTLWVAAQAAATANMVHATPVIIDGHVLTKLEDASSVPTRTSYAWSSGDAIIIVGSENETIVKEVLAKVS
jgi:hypothetical protein